jgi:hypothetical protein
VCNAYDEQRMGLPDLLALSVWPLIALAFWLMRRAKGFSADDLRAKVLVGISGTLMLAPFIVILVMFQH